MPIKFNKKPVLDKNSYTNINSYEAWLYGEGIDIGGGKITKQEIDELAQYPGERIAVTGLKQDSFEYFISKYAQRYKAIYFFKNKMVTDLSPLGELSEVRALGYFLNQRAERLWDMSGNKQLEMLEISDFSRLKDLTGIESAPKLKCLEFGNRVWARTKIEKVPDMAGSVLESVSHNAELPPEYAVRFLDIPSLRSFDFRPNIYKTEFLAWICANYPNIEGWALKPYHLFDDNTGFICGKRKPYIDMTIEKDRLRAEKSAAAFEKMKEEYRGMSYDEIMSIISR